LTKRLQKQDFDIIVDEIAAVMVGRSDAVRLDQAEPLPDVAGFGDTGPALRLVIDRRGCVLQISAQAAAVLGLATGDQISTITDSPQIARDFLAQCSAGSDPQPLTLLGQEEARLMFLGIAAQDSDQIILQEVRRGLKDGVQERLAQTIGLTAGETQVYFKLLQGQPIKTIAAQLNKTEGTIRQQVKAVLAKAGVNSQVQLVSIAYALSLTADRAARPPVAINPAPAVKVSWAGTDAPYMRFGQQDGLPVLIMHGALFGVAALPALHMAAQSLGLDVIVPIRPGYGDNVLQDGAQAVDQTIAQVCRVLDACQRPRVVVVAHDIGTRFAVRLARAHPARVAALVAAPTTPPMLGWQQTSDMPLRHRANAWASQNLPGLMDRLVLLGLAQIAQKGGSVIPHLVFSGCDFDQSVMRQPENRPVLDEIAELVMQQGGQGFCNDMQITNEDWSGDLPHLPMPVIALHGGESLTVSRRAVEQMVAQLPDGHFRLVPDAGHSMPLSHAALILRYAFAAGMRAGLAGSDHGMI
jgi:pimeloyl-ACP methyl ester carboxylesterase/DNA-binding CsgD family transcriptional regulator